MSTARSRCADRARSPGHGARGGRNQGHHADGHAEQRRAECAAAGRIDPIGRAGRDHRDPHGHRPAHLAAGVSTARKGQDPVPSTLDWDLWLGPAAARPYQELYPKGHPVYKPPPEKKHQLDFMVAGRPGPADGVVYHPFIWRGWTEFGSGSVGDIAPHAMNVIFMALDLGAPSAVEVVETSGMRREMYPGLEHDPLRLGAARRASAAHHLLVRRREASSARGRAPRRPHLDRNQGQSAAGRGPFIGQKMDPYECLHAGSGAAKRSTRTGLWR